MKKNYLGYKIGLAVIGIFVVGVAIFVMMQAGNTKKDADTDKAANKIAEKLNNYISTNNKIPDSLGQVGAASVPTTVTYTKLSDSKYKFCVNYKTTSSGYDATEAVYNVATGNTLDTTPPDYNITSSLYIPSTHHKGANCQTIKPYLATYITSGVCASANANGACYDYMCGSSYADTWSAIKVTSVEAATAAHGANITINSLPDAKTFQLNQNVKYFDANCAPISLSDFKPGDSITLYFSTTGEADVAMITKDS
ncbi:MAG TPA: hypothetical protein VLG47_04745 [Candidatus Saccharimonadales bacterium]|nr:hypothetical protein [Candidatus Saccharimonadales bacterium]